MKSIKKQLFMTVLCIVFGLCSAIGAVTLWQLTEQKNEISQKGRMEAQALSQETKETLERINEQTARDFSGASIKYFDRIFSNMRKHVDAVRENLTELYGAQTEAVAVDDNLGLITGVTREEISGEFGKISSIRQFIKYLPGYDADNLKNLDLYVMTESGMCLDGTGTALGNDYADLRKEDWYQEAKKSGRIYWSGVFTGKVTGRQKVICAMPVYDKNDVFMGCVAGDVSVEEGAFQEIIEEFDEPLIKSVIFFDRDGALMYATNDYPDTTHVKEYLGRVEIVNLGNEVYSFAKLPETGWTVCLVLDQEQISQTTGKFQTDVEENVEGILWIVQGGIQRIMLIFSVSMAVGIVLAVIVTNALATGFVRPIRQLIAQVKEVGTGNLNQQIEVSSQNEIGLLAGEFQSMTVELKDYMNNLQHMTADKERMTAQLDVARQIQMNMLPREFPDRKEFQVYADMHSVSEGGGNFYDFFMADKRHFCVVVGNVSGTGIPTTLFAVITKTNIKNYAQLGYQPDRILAETNNQLSYKNEAGLTVSVFVGIVDLQTGNFQYVNAGEMAPLWKQSGKDFEFLKASQCFALANMENVPYRKQSVRLTQGDMLFLYTEGIPKTTDAKGNEYTQEYLYEYLNTLVKHKYQVREIGEAVWENLGQFCNGALQKKDSTILILRYFGQ